MVRPDLLSINHEVDSAVTRRLIAKGWPVFIWTPDEEADIRAALAKRPYGVISNEPVRAKELEAARLGELQFVIDLTSASNALVTPL